MFAGRGVGGSQIAAWIEADTRDGFSVGHHDGTLWKGLEVMGMTQDADKAAVVAELQTVIAARRAFEIRVSVTGYLCGAVLAGRWRGVSRVLTQTLSAFPSLPSPPLPFHPLLRCTANHCLLR